MENGENIINGWSETEFDNGNHNGLTKREYFAGLAMQGFCSNIEWAKSLTTDDCDDYEERLTIGSVKLADALLAELEKNK